MVSRRTPEGFRPGITNATVQVLPLVTDPRRQWNPGWCTYTDGFDLNPDIEIFCGGENDKTATAAACWRQGNLLHFGFEQTPSDLNDTGRELLLNCIAYISRFTEDQPIAVTPSVFSGPVAPPRTYLDRRLRDKKSASEIDWIVQPSIIQLLKGKSPDEIVQWYDEHRGFLHPGAEGKLELDKDALALRIRFDTPEFFERAIAALRKGGVDGRRAGRLLAGYAPLDAPQSTNPDSWDAWLRENRPYLFFSDQGDYGWYIDPLAKKRGVPSQQLRGPVRASISEGPTSSQVKSVP